MPVIVMDADGGVDDQNESIRSLGTFLALDQALNEPPKAEIVEENERTLICWSSGSYFLYLDIFKDKQNCF